MLRLSCRGMREAAESKQADGIQSRNLFRLEGEYRSIAYDGDLRDQRDQPDRKDARQEVAVPGWYNHCLCR